MAKNDTATLDEKRVKSSPPDGGYGWAVCASACTVQFILAGLMNNFGILYIHIVDEFNAGKGISALVGSVNVGFMCLVSPFTVIVSNWRGTRETGLIGGALTVAGLAMSGFVDRLYLMILTYGVVYGIGSSFCYTTTFNVLAMWFDKQLSLVNGLCTAAIFISTIVFSPVLQYMLVSWGLHKTLLIMAGVSSTNALAALVYKEPPQYPSNSETCEKGNKKLLDFTLLKDKPFLVLALGMVVYIMGGFTPALFVPSFAKDSGVPEDKVPYLLIVWSIVSILSSFALGKIADKFRSHRVLICQITMFGVASATALFATVSSFAWFMTIMALYGIFKCGFILLRPVIVTDVVGVVKTPSALGMVFGLLGIGNVASQPFIGWIVDMTQSYPLAFLVSAGFVAVGGSLLLLIPVLQARKDKKNGHHTTCCQIKQVSPVAKEQRNDSVSYAVLEVEVNEPLEPEVEECRVLSGVTYAYVRETRV